MVRAYGALSILEQNRLLLTSHVPHVRCIRLQREGGDSAMFPYCTCYNRPRQAYEGKFMLVVYANFKSKRHSRYIVPRDETRRRTYACVCVCV